MRKHFRILNVGCAAVILISLFCLVAMGKVYPLKRTYFSSGAEIVSARMEAAPENVVRLASAYLDENEQATFILEAGERGRTEAHFFYTVRFADGGLTEMQEYATLEVNRAGSILDRSYGGLNFNGYRIVLWSILVLLFLIFTVMLRTFFDYRRQGEFSYAMVACGGIAIFSLALLALTAYKLLNNGIASFSAYVNLVYGVGELLLLGLLPFMLASSVFLAVSNFWLLRHEGFRPVNGLGIAFAISCLVGTAFTIFYSYLPGAYHLPETLRRALMYMQCYFECMFLSTAACAFLAARYKPPLDRDDIIILGCAIRRDGSLTPLLRTRVDSALAFEKEQYETTGKHARFIPSGGQGADECVSEGEAMERYLREQGVPDERIAREDKSVNTLQNMAFSKRVIEEHGGLEGRRIAFATTNYHVFRGYVLSRKCGFTAKGISARTKTYFYPNAYLREFIGLLYDQKYRHLAYIVTTVLCFLLLSMR